MWKKLSLGFFSVIALLLVLVALKSPHYEISRQTRIQAPVEKVFPYLNSSKLSEQWAPWKEIDPAAKMTYSGPESGVGSKASWEGGTQLGSGSATIVESIPNQRVGIALEYVTPMAMRQYSEYTVESSGAETVVTWKVKGENSFPGRLMGLFMNMDKTVGGMFEKGLGNLKSLAEKP